MRVAVCLGVALLAAVMVSVGVARPPRTGLGAPAGAQPKRAPDTAKAPAARPSQFWRLERRYVALQHEEGRLGAEVRRLRRQVAVRRLQAAHTAPVVRTPYYAIRLAASAYHVSEGEMRAVASCETGGTFSSSAHNTSSGASGLFQFLGSTWASQGLTGFSVYDPVANALAAARIVSREGWAQWQCKPQ